MKPKPNIITTLMKLGKMNSKTNGTITIIKSDLLTKTKNSSIIKMMMLEPSKTVEILNHKPLQISIK